MPLFGLANAGIAIDAGSWRRALTSPITLGVFLGYVLGKPIAVVGVSWLVTRLSRGRVRPTVGWAAVLGSGTIAGIGFTVSLLIANLAFEGDAAGRGEARRARRAAVVAVGADLAGVPGDRAAARGDAGPARCSATPSS